ncbi:MAG: hypothetical protein JJU21_09760 [Salinarimonas sp.]|nr:hypothetical protein [Salinarimonas sp.]
MLKGAFAGLLRNVVPSGGIDRAEIERVRALAVEVLGLSADTIVKVNEINCTDPACPGQETVVLIMEPGARTRAVKVRAPIEDVDESALQAAVTEAEADAGAGIAARAG